MLHSICNHMVNWRPQNTEQFPRNNSSKNFMIQWESVLQQIVKWGKNCWLPHICTCSYTILLMYYPFPAVPIPSQRKNYASQTSIQPVEARWLCSGQWDVNGSERFWMEGVHFRGDTPSVALCFLDERYILRLTEYFFISYKFTEWQGACYH